MEACCDDIGVQPNAPMDTPVRRFDFDVGSRCSIRPRTYRMFLIVNKSQVYPTAVS